MHSFSPKSRKLRNGRRPPEGGRRQLGEEYDFDRHVGRRVRERRTELGMSQARLAGELGLTFQQVQKYERGTNRISASKLHRLSHILRVPHGHFFEGLGQAPTDADQPVLHRATMQAARLLAGLDPRKRRAAVALLRSIGSAGDA